MTKHPAWDDAVCRFWSLARTNPDALGWELGWARATHALFLTGMCFVPRSVSTSYSALYSLPKFSSPTERLEQVRNYTEDGEWTALRTFYQLLRVDLTMRGNGTRGFTWGKVIFHEPKRGVARAHATRRNRDLIRSRRCIPAEYVRDLPSGHKDLVPSREPKGEDICP